MTEEILWEGTVRLVAVKEGDETILRWDCEDFDIEKLEDVLKLNRHVFGERIVNTMRLAFIGWLEQTKIEFIFL